MKKKTFLLIAALSFGITAVKAQTQIIDISTGMNSGVATPAGSFDTKWTTVQPPSSSALQPIVSDNSASTSGTGPYSYTTTPGANWISPYVSTTAGAFYGTLNGSPGFSGIYA